MRLKFIGTPSEVTHVALSGGIDSMVLVQYLRKGGHNPTAVYVNHLTPHGSEAEIFVDRFCEENDIKLCIYRINADKPSGVSPEEHWRNERYRIFSEIPGTIATAQHLDDQVETYLMGCVNGVPKVMPYRRDHVVRPFLLNTREQIRTWALENKVTWIEDPSNQDTKYKRNLVRKSLVTSALLCNPGFYKVVRKKVLVHAGLP